MRLYVGEFADVGGKHRQRICEWAAQQAVGGGPIKVVGLEEVVPRALELAASTQYRDTAALVTIKIFDSAGALAPLDVQRHRLCEPLCADTPAADHRGAAGAAAAARRVG